MKKAVIRYGDVPDEDDNRHDLNNDGQARDSLALMLIVPEQGIAGFVYPTVNGEGLAVTTVCLFGGPLESPVLEQFSEMVSADMDFYNWQTGGLILKIGEPHKTLDVSWRGERIDVDFHYQALHPSYAFSSGVQGSPPYYGKDRTEQHGTIIGTIRVDDRQFEFETIMVRDHSWGPRVWGLNQHYKWFHAAAKEASMHFFEMQSYGSTHFQGFMNKDGLMTQLDSVEYDFVLDDDLIMQSIDVVAKDVMGRSMTVTSKAYAHYSFDTDPVIMLNEAATEALIDGYNGVGWVEFCWNRDYLTFARKFPQFR